MRWAGAVIFSGLVACGLFTVKAQRTAGQAQEFPMLYWTQGTETAEALKQYRIERIAAPPEKTNAWRGAGISVVAMTERELERREKLLVPRVAGRANVASATRRPWIDANGWRFIRNPAGKFYYDLRQNARARVALAVAEAFAYKADAILKIDPADLDEAGKMFKSIRELPGENYPPIADIAVVDNGSAIMGEVLNLLTRRNLLFNILSAPSARYRVNIKLGTREYPETDAADPNEFVQKIRHKLGDENRTVRIYGSETVIVRHTGDSRGYRLHLLNYSGVEIDGLRVRIVRAQNAGGNYWAFGFGSFRPESPVTEAGALEFSIPRMGTYAVLDGYISQ